MRISFHSFVFLSVLISFAFQFGSPAFGEVKVGLPTTFRLNKVKLSSVSDPMFLKNVDLITPTADKGNHYVRYDLPSSSSPDTYQFSVALKSHGANFVYLGTSVSGVISRSYFDIMKGATGSKASSLQSSIEPLGQGYFLCTIQFQGKANVVTQLHIGIAQSDGQPAFGSDEESGLLIADPSQLVANQRKPIVGMWVWGSSSVTNTAKANDILAFSSAKGVNRLYVESEALVKKYPDTLAAFITAAKAKNIDVELLFGDPSWAFSANHQEALDLVTEAVEFSKTYPQAKPIGIHFDVEPYSLPEWTQDMNGTANQLLDLYQSVQSQLVGTGLQLTGDAPAWFNTRTTVRNGLSQNLSEAFATVVDVVGLMDYHNTLSSIASNASSWVTYASQHQKLVEIGVETQCISPASITFCGQTDSSMQSILTSLDQQTSSEKGYLGHAIHYYDSWAELLP